MHTDAGTHVAPSHHAPHTPHPASRRAAVIFFVLASMVVLYYTWQVISPYATPILLAAVIGSFTHTPYERLATKLGDRRGLAAWIMCLLVTLVIIVPLFLLTLILIQEAVTILQRFTPQNIAPILEALRVDQLQEWLQSFAPGVELRNLDLQGSILSIAKKVPEFLVSWSGAFLSGTVDMLLKFFLMIITLAYFYVDGTKLLRQTLYLSPLPSAYEHEFVEKFRGIVRSTFKGSFLIGIAQGVALAIGFSIVGIPGAVFWGAVTVVFSFLPMIGSALVWGPATIILTIPVFFSQADPAYWKPLFLLAWGLLIVSTIDNFVRPFVMTEDVHLPAIVLFFSILGGVEAFGFVGILLGPLLFAFLATLIHIYKDLFHEVLREQDRRWL